MIALPNFAIILFFVIPILVILYALFDILFSRFESTAIKIICFTLVVATPLLGALIYFVFTKRLKQAH